jgi:hypothetical protein
MAAPAALTAGLFCAAIQYGYNGLRVRRLRSLGEANEPMAAPEPRENHSWTWMPGFTKVSDEEYLIRLKKQREHALARIAILEQEEEQRREESEN